MIFGQQREIFVKNQSCLALTPMSFSARLEVDWSTNIHISVQKLQFFLIFLCFLVTRGSIIAYFLEKLVMSGPDPHEY